MAKRNAALRLTEADIAKLSPTVRARLGLAEGGSKKADGKRFEVSWLAPALGKRVTYRSAVKASNKEGAIKEVRSWLRGMSFWEHKGATNFMAKEVKQNPKRAKGKAQRAKRNPVVTAVTPAIAARWLKTNPSKKDMVQARITAIAKQITAGTYKPKTPLLFKNGKLIDGRHRLSAVVRAGKSVKFPIERVRTNPKHRPSAKKKAAAPNKSSARLQVERVMLKLADLRRPTCEDCGKRPVDTKGLNRKLVCRECFKKQLKGNPPILADIIGGLAGGAGYAAASLYVSEKLKRKTKPTGRGGGAVATDNPKRKAKRVKRGNPPGDIHKEFTGRESRNVLTSYHVPNSAPTNLDQLGKLVEIKLARRNPWTFENNPARLCAAKVGNKRRMFIALKNPYTLPNGADANKLYNYGPIIHVVYKARKPHLYPGDNREHDFIHRMGEEGGRRPNLIMQNGMLMLRGGDYTIQREGIRN